MQTTPVSGPTALPELRAPELRNASGLAADAIRDAILDGRLEPGVRLKERELGRSLGISATPVREALHALESEGLVDIVPHRGAVVRSYDAASLEELYRLRALLEGYAAREAASAIGEAELAELDASCARFARVREQGDVLRMARENLAFHTTVHEAAGGDHLPDLIRRVTQLPLVYRVFVWYSPEQQLVSERAHVALVRHLRERDAAAAEAVMHGHVLDACAVVAERTRRAAR